MSFRVFGKVVEAESGEGVSNLVICATDKDFLVDDFLGAATTDGNGYFEIAYEAKDFMDLLFERKPDIFLRVASQQGRLIHTTEDRVRYAASPSEEFIIKIPRAQLPDEVKDPVETERQNFTQLLLENPNYFGTVPASDFQPVMPMQGNTKYEELRCLGFYPELDQLEAIFDVKLPYGYSGRLCSNGSYEYVRFYVDWDGDGDFDDPEEDVGMVSVNVHDIPNSGGICRDRSKPLSYAVKLNIDPKKFGCKKPNLVKVRAILSWRLEPDPGMPDYPVIWGNVLEKWIQIEPVLYKFGHFLDAINFSKVEVDPDLLNPEVIVSQLKSLTPEQLQAIYEDKDVPEQRYKFQQFKPLVAQIKQQPALLAQYKLDPAYANILEPLQALLASKSNTRYEELRCVGLLYTRDTLMATLTVKLPYGYKGNLCDDGSQEYVGFWARIYDKIEQQCVWRHLGTARVNVHDIPTIPDEGLQYAVYLPYDFSEWKKPCNNPVVMQIRAVLSWDDPPTDPEEPPKWGNIVDALIQLKPEDATIPGDQKPYLWSVGDMAVQSISGNPYTIIGSALGAGYANGISQGGGFLAIESPFGGIAEITGKIEGAPDTDTPNNPNDPNKLRYKVQYNKVGSGTGWHNIDNPFRIWIAINGVPSDDPIDLIATDGYYRYQKDTVSPNTVDVQGDVLAQWDTRKAEGDGLYRLRLLLYKPGAPAIPGVPADHVASREIRVMVDNTAPFAAISLDAGPCTKFKIGDSFTGKFTATDAHIWRYSLWVEPGPPSAPNPPTIVPPTSETYPALGDPGKVDESFTVQTTIGTSTTPATTPCGYVIRIGVRDRTIVNNHFPGHYTSTSVGLCLLAEETSES
ncbi:MAG: hypothetical protein QNJ47_22145 [Nostocaceae cyanobacterium]|nr:hypothetical protein [Nostocaceae cyanobacterium]